MNVTTTNVLVSLYPQVVRTLGDVAYDANGNKVSYDAAAVTAGVNWEDLRIKRNKLLAETDHLALSDHVLTPEMTAYRQALRDLPSNTTDPANPVWPTKPEA